MIITGCHFLSGAESELHFCGRLTDAFGFPSQDLFEGYGGQLLDCSTFTDQPFLIEKIEVSLDYEWDNKDAIAGTQYDPFPAGTDFPSSRFDRFMNEAAGSGYAKFLATQLSVFCLRQTSETKDALHHAKAFYGGETFITTPRTYWYLPRNRWLWAGYVY